MWPKAQMVSRIVLYDRPNLDGQITAAAIRFFDGTALSTGTLTSDSSALIPTLAAKTVTYAEPSIDTVKNSTVNMGLSETEVWAG
jgi:hypothetical protein